MQLTVAIAALALAASSAVADKFGNQYQNPANLPAKVEPNNQNGYNDCIQRYGASNPNALCENLYINSIKDFCLYGPPSRGKTIGDLEQVVVSYCLKSGYGTRLIPDGTIKGAHFLKTPSYLQVTGVGDLTKINVLKGDAGGELDPHGADGAGNPHGALIFSRALNGTFQRLSEWQHFISDQEFCLRACIPGQYDTKWCPHIYDVMGCYWNEPANYNANQFEQCDGTEGQWPGVYSGSTWYQGQKPTPPAQAPGSSSNCRQYPTVSQGPAAVLPKKRDVMETQVARKRADFDDLDY